MPDLRSQIAIMDLPALIGGGDAPFVAKIMLGIVAFAFVFGAGSATLLKYRAPARFENLSAELS